MALAGAAERCVGEGLAAFTYRDLAERAQVGYGAAQHTVSNMARAGELADAGLVREPGICRPLRAYTLRAADAPAPVEPPELADVLCTWVDL